MKKLLFVFTLLLIHYNLIGQKATKTENLILITLDGMRWQEVFGGAEARLIRNKKVVDDTTALKKIFWAQTPGDRREKLIRPDSHGRSDTHEILTVDQHVGIRQKLRSRAA